MQRLLVLGAMLVLACSNPVADEVMEMAGESICLEGILVDLERTVMGIKGYPVKAWSIPIPGLIEVSSVRIESTTGDWLIPLYFMESDVILIPEQTNITIYSKYLIKVRIK